jgi:type IV pilus assembly protein PilA
MKKLSKGFTLIELLIVIAVLGILAVAVLSAINPIEQINRSRDTGSRSDAEQLLGAIDRYYATQGFYPWKTSPILPAVSDVTAWAVVDTTTWTDGATAVLTKLAAAGTAEVKSSFTTRITATGYNTLYKYNRGTSGDSTYLCFLPKSASFQTEAGGRCGATLPADYPASACPAGCATAKTCYSCLP